MVKLEEVLKTVNWWGFSLHLREKEECVLANNCQDVQELSSGRRPAIARLARIFNLV